MVVVVVSLVTLLVCQLERHLTRKLIVLVNIDSDYLTGALCN